VLYVSRRSWETGVAPRPDEMIWSTVPRDRRKNA
jgi:putative heme transporter